MVHPTEKEEVDQQCPVRNTKIKQYIPDWINPSLRDLIRDRDYFYKKAKRTGNEDDWNIAQHLRIRVYVRERPLMSKINLKNMPKMGQNSGEN